MKNLITLCIFSMLLTFFMLSCQSAGTGSEGNENIDSTAVSSDDSTFIPPADLKNLNPEETVIRFYQAIKKKDFKTAQIIKDGSISGYENLAGEYKNVQHVDLAITGETFTEASAGTAYASVPVRVDLVMAGGEKKVKAGNCLLSRPNSPEHSDQAWRIYAIEFEDSDAPATGAGEEEKVGYIRQEFKSINEANYKVHTHSLDCGEVSYYVDANENIRKVKRSWFAGDYGGDEEYYFKNGQLIFVYYWEEGGPANGKVTRQECRYYFYKDELIRTLASGPRPCLETDQIKKMATDIESAFLQKKYSLLNCFDQ